MLEKIFYGSRKYWSLVAVLIVLFLSGVFAYWHQYEEGLAVTGMSRDVSWGLYISQFTFLVGVAASAVTVVLPYYLHDFKAFGKITILGEFLAISSVLMCVLFIFVDLGQPLRVLNIFLHPSVTSPMFWDTVVLFGYLILNLIIGWSVLHSEYKKIEPAKWVKILIYISIPWAISIHTVTAFLYAGIPGRHMWLSAITGARFLASAFASGPALLIILGTILKKNTTFDPGKDAFKALGKIIAYSFSGHLFFILLEVFTAFYSGIPSHQHSLVYLFSGLEGFSSLTPIMWISMILAVLSLICLYTPDARNNETILLITSVAVFISIWLEKGVGFVVGGFIPNPLGTVTEYWPTIPETVITVGIWSLGFLILTFFYKITISVREKE